MTLSRREFSVLLASSLAALSVPGSRAGGSLRIRRDINSLSATELAAFRTGVAAMRALPSSDPTSLLWQSYVHGTFLTSVPGVTPEDFLAYFNRCNHGTHFVSWHRWYTLFWEEICRQLSGTDEFNLPYWDAVGDLGFLPAAVRWPLGVSSNSLYDVTRHPQLNDGSAAISGLHNDSLQKTQFTTFNAGPGSVKDIPHNRVHNQMGGNMTAFETAAQDPIFWLHHCNVDRYWDCWLKLAGHANPGSPFTDQTFSFYTLNGPQTILVGNGMLASDLGYAYDKCPGKPLFKIPHKLLNIALFEVPYIELPTPDPPPPIIRTLLETRAFTLDGRSNVLVLSRDALARTGFDFNDPAASLAIGLRNITPSELAALGGYEIEIWLASEARLVERNELEGAVQIGSLGMFSLGHAHHAAHGQAPSQVFELDAAARRVLGGRTDPGIVFVRRGLVDRRGVDLPFDAKAPLFDIGGFIVGVSGE